MISESERNNQKSPPENKEESSVNAKLEAVGNMPMPSGLSALIQVATSHFGQLIDKDDNDAPAQAPAASSLGNNTEADPYTGVTTDDGASSDGGERLEESGKQTLTPTIVQEPDPLRQSFPELLMTLAIDPRNTDIIAFLPDGKFFAIRVKEFTESILKEYFPVTAFDEFLELTYDWGFTRILQDQNETGIEVFRHPQFIKGDFAKCKDINFGETPTSARVLALPEAARLDYTVMDESSNSAANSKRRLSPGFIKRRESESSNTLKKRLSLEGVSNQAAAIARAESEGEDVGSYANHSRGDDIRSVALALTTEKLNLHQEKTLSPSEKSSQTLIDQAVKSTTHTIVTDAIETLLNDEAHTKQTFLKHEKELSKSSLPGVIPISKMLFEEKGEDKQGDSMPQEVTTKSCGIMELSEAAALKSEELRAESERAERAPTAKKASEEETEGTKT